MGKDFEYEIVDAEELGEFANIGLSSLTQQQSFFCSAPFSLLEYHITQLFGKQNVQRAQPNSLVVMNNVTLEDCGKNNLYILTWNGNAINDMIADAVAAISIHAEISRSSIKMTKHAHDHSHNHSMDIDIILKYLGEHFECVSVDEDNGKFIVGNTMCSDEMAFIDIETLTVECQNENIKELVQKKLDKLMTVFQIVQ